MRRVGVVLLLGFLFSSVSLAVEPPAPEAAAPEAAKPTAAESMAVLRPLLVKIGRLSLAVNLGNWNLLRSELDSFPVVRDEFARGVATPAGAGLEKVLPETEPLIALQSMALLAQDGRLDEFDAKMGSLELKPEMRDVALVYVWAFQSARKAGDTARAARYLELSRKYLPAEARGRPVLEYVLRTSEHQLRRDQGYQPDKGEWATDYRRAWSALQDYTPLKSSEADIDWCEGRLASNYWTENLVHSPNIDLPRDVMLVQLSKWSEKMSSPFPDDISNDGVLLRIDELMAFQAILLAQADQMTFLLEQRRLAGRKDDVSEILGDASSLVDDLIGLSDLYLKIPVGPGFPAIDPKVGGLIPELRRRIEFLRG